MDEYDATYLLLRTVGQWCVGISTDVYLGRTVGSPWNVRLGADTQSVFITDGGDIPQSGYPRTTSTSSRRIDECEDPLAVRR